MKSNAASIAQDRSDPLDVWLPALQAFPLLREQFRTYKTMQYYTWRRELNGLSAADAVRLSPVGKRLIVNPARVKRWARGELR